jgi:hypothetical protein
MAERALALHVAAPAGRGAAWTAEDVARKIFSNRVTARWVKDNFKAGRDRIGHRTVIWWENDARRWRDTHPLTGTP